MGEKDQVKEALAAAIEPMVVQELQDFASLLWGHLATGHLHYGNAWTWRTKGSLSDYCVEVELEFSESDIMQPSHFEIRYYQDMESSNPEFMWRTKDTQPHSLSYGLREAADHVLEIRGVR